MHTITRHHYEAADPRLGRHVKHDSRSRDFAFLPADAKPQGKNTFWNSSAKPLNQGQLGSCTGNATAQWLNTSFAAPVRAATHHGRYLTEGDAVAIYSLGTRLDNVAGQYPPDDTGCNGISVAKAAEQLGYLDGYKHTFSFSSLQAALEITPAIVGTVWTNTMFHPTNGLVSVGPLTDSNIAGGHEYLAAGLDFTEEAVIFRNSWGDQADWPGCKPGGYFAVGFKDYAALLEAHGDVTVLHGKGQA